MRTSTNTFIVLLLSVFSSGAAIITASSGSRADVVTAIESSAICCDTVLIPSGSNYWATPVTFTNNLTIKGSGTWGTIIGGAYQAFISDTLSGPNITQRISNIRFELPFPVTLNGINTNGGRHRLDNCLATNYSGWFVTIDGALGVVDHNYIYGVGQVPWFYVHHNNWDGGYYSDGSQRAGNLYGTDQFIFFENNYVTNTGAQQVTGGDGYIGARYVARYNTIRKISFEVHGWESGAFRGGRAFEIYMNDMESNDSGALAGYWRSGSGLVWSNSVRGYQDTATPFQIVYQAAHATGLRYSAGGAERGGADGINPWMSNVVGGPFLVRTGLNSSVTNYATAGTYITVTNNGTPMVQNAYIGYAINRTSGKPVTSITKDTVGIWATAVCTSHGFTNGQRVTIKGASPGGWNSLYYITNVDANTFTFQMEYPYNFTSPASGTIIAIPGMWFSTIVSNFTNTITYMSSAHTTPGPPFDSYDLVLGNGDTFELYRTKYGMDQPGRTGGSEISTADPATVPSGWNNQTNNPWFVWNNTRESGVAGMTSSYTHIVYGEHYIVTNDAPAGYIPFTYPHPLIASTEGVAATGPHPKAKINGKFSGVKQMMKSVGKTITK